VPERVLGSVGGTFGSAVVVYSRQSSSRIKRFVCKA